jgi:DNA-binding NarL/FixJ family response regulator
LVVEDFKPFRQFIVSVLTKMPELQVIGEASDGLEALRVAEELRPELILLDIGLPSLNGIEAARRICQVAPGVKLLFVSQISDIEIVAKALTSGAQGYVLKTDAGTELLPAIAAILRGERFLSSGIKKVTRP